jgi:hypothetical protein
MPILAAARRDHGITMITPLLGDSSRQAKTRNGYSRNEFTIDYDACTASCPQGQGQTSAHWNPQVRDVSKRSTSPSPSALLDLRRPARVHHQQGPPASDHRLPARDPRTATGHPEPHKTPGTGDGSTSAGPASKAP